MRERTPDVLQQLLAIGAREVAGQAPDGSTEPGDEVLVLLLCRRPMFERVLRRAVEREPRVRVILPRLGRHVRTCGGSDGKG